jgi:hypothetical protein
MALALCAASLIVLSGPLVEGCMVPFLWGWSKVHFPFFRWSTAIAIDAVHWIGVIVLIVIVARRPWSFVLLWGFPLLHKLVKVLDLRLAEFCKLLRELWHCFRPLPD